MTARFVLHIRELSDVDVVSETRGTSIARYSDPTDDIAFARPGQTIADSDTLVITADVVRGSRSHEETF